MTAFYIVGRDSEYPYAYCENEAAARSQLAQLTAAEPDKWEGATVIDCDAWFAARESMYLATPIEEVTAERWDWLLNCLPPMDWRHAEGVERFNMCEMTFARVTVQAAQMDGRYFTKHVRHGDRSTYMTRDMITAALPGIAPPACG